MIVETLIALAVVTTILSAGLAALRYKAGAAAVAGGALFGLCYSFGLIWLTYVKKMSLVWSLGPLEFVINPLTAFFTLTVFIIGFAAALYAVDIEPKRNAAALPPFLSSFIFTVALLGLSGNVLTACIFVELQALSIIYTLIAGEEYASEAAVKYLYMTFLGTMFELLGLGLLFKAVVPAAMVIVTGLALFSIGLLLKVGVVPLHAWLPDVHARAHTSASAVLSSVAVASGYVALMNILLAHYSSMITAGTLAPYGYVILGYGIASMLYGSLCAVSQPDVKRALAYSTIGHMGFASIPLGIGLVTAPLLHSLTAIEMLFAVSLLYLVVHALGKSLLFLAGGLPVALYGVHEYTHLGGLFRRHKVATWTFLGGALTLAGLPPLPGFFAKLLVILTAVDLALKLGPYLGGAVVALVIGAAIITPAYAIRRLWHRTFLGEARDTELPETPKTYLANAACIILLLALIVLGTAPVVLALPHILIPPLPK